MKTKMGWVGALWLLLATSALAGDDTSFEQTLDVQKGTRLEIECQAGYASIRAWDKEQVSVLA